MTEASDCVSALSLFNAFNVVTLPIHVLRENRSGVAPGAKAALDQSSVAIESGFLFDQSAHLRFAAAHRLRKRAMPEPLGMLEPGHRDDDDRGRALHARLRILRGDDGETVRAGRGRTAAGRRSGAADGFEACRHYRGRARRSERWRRESFCADDRRHPRDGSSVIIEVLVPDFHAQDWCIQIVLDAAPDIFNHNMETVERLTPLVRSRAKYRTSLEVLRTGKGAFAEGRDQKRRDARPGRDGAGTFPDDGRSARGRLPGV